MRIRFKKSDLVPAAAVAQSVANPQSTLPILANVLIVAEGGEEVTFLATDYESRVRIEVPAIVEVQGTTTVPAKTFYDLVKELPEDAEVVFETRERGALIRSAGIRVELATMPHQDFPRLPEFTPKLSFEVEQRELKRLLSKVLFAVPVRDPRKVLLGALFELRAGSLAAVATDGKILAYARMPVQQDFVEVDGESNIIVSHRMLEELGRNLGDEGMVTIALDERQISFRLNRIYYLSNQIEGKYPNYEAVVPKSFSLRFPFKKGPMLSAIRRASILSDIKNLAMSLQFEPNRLVVESESYDKGRLHEEMVTDIQDADFKIVFNYRFVADVLKSLDKDEVVLHANGPTTPAVFRCDESPDNYYLIMPIKLAEIKEYAPDGGGDLEENARTAPVYQGGEDEEYQG